MKIKTILLSLPLSLVLSIVAAQNLKETQYQAYLLQSPELWKKALSLQINESKKSPQDETNQLILGYSYYSLLCGSAATQDENFFDQYAADAKKLLKEIMEKNPQSGEVKAMLSGVYGLEMGFSPMKGMLLGAKSHSLINEAIKLEPNAALVWKIYGNSKFYTPSAFGGDVKEAIKALEKSIQSFEVDPSSLKKNWLYLNTILLLGQAYKKENEVAKAKSAYEKALSFEPEFDYAKKLLEKASSKK